MDDVVNRNVPIAEENLFPNDHPAKDMFGDWSSDVSETIDDTQEDIRKLSPEEREKRLKEMDEIVKKDLE